jgi:PAS domain S-box-containing protein
VFHRETLAFLAVNLAAVERYGYSREEFLGMTLRDIRPPEEVPALLAALERPVGRPEKPCAWKHRRKDGSLVDVEITACDVEFAGFPGRLVLAQDVTDRLRVEEALRESEERFRQVTETIPEAFWVSETGTNRLIYISPAYERIWGRPAGELYRNPESWLEGIHPDDRETVRLTAERIRRGAEIRDLEYRVVRPDGSIRWILDSAFPVRGATGEVRRYVGLARDVTESKQVQLDLERTLELVRLVESVAVAANESATLEEALQAALDAVCDLTKWPVGHAYIRSRDEADVLTSGPWHLDEPDRYVAFREISDRTRFTAGVGLPGRVLAAGKPAWIPDVLDDSNFPRAHAAVDIGVRGGFAFPVVVESDVEAVLEFFSPRIAEPDENLLRVLAQVGNQIGVVLERKRWEEALRNIAEGISAKTGEPFFESLVTYLAKVLRAEYAFVAEITGESPERMSTVAFCARGELAPNFEYLLEGTPCADVVRDRIWCHPRGVREAYPNVRMLDEMNAEGYLGTALYDSAGRPLGLLAVLTTTPLRSPRKAESMVRIFAARAAAELERRRAEKARQESQERYEIVARATNDAVWDWDLLTNRLRWNEMVYTLFGYPPGAVGPDLDWWSDRLHPAERDRVLAGLEEAVQGDASAWSDEYRFQRADGSYAHVLDRGYIIRDETGKGVRMIGSMQDISPHKQAEESLRHLSARLLRIQDEERRRIARELHDSTAQSLAALSMHLELLRKNAPRLAPTARRHLREGVELATQCSRELRTLSYLLHPPLLDEAGLALVVRWYADGFARRSGTKVDLKISERLGRLPAEVEMTLFRIVQESLSNIHRHSGSRTATIRLSRRKQRVTLEVKDRGRGIPSESLHEGRDLQSLGVGIAGMRERVRQLGGELQILSARGGTTVRVDLPLPGAA